MELEFVKWLAEQLPPTPNLPTGLADDAALLAVPEGRQLVVTTDLLTDRVHFDATQHSLQRIGRKSLAVNLSDLAAMAAEPLAAFVSVCLPRGPDAEQVARDLYAGILPLAEEFDCPIAGGDTNSSDGPLTIAITALGTVIAGRAWRRSRAQPGDRLLVTGALGGSLLGHHLDFRPRVAEARAMEQEYDIHAAMDISDGLALDLARLATASNVGAVVDVAHIPISAAAQTMAAESGRSPLQHALGDGEDFELLLAVPKPAAEQLLDAQPLACGLTDVGEIVEGAEVRQRTADGSLSALEVVGYQHG